MDMRPLKTKRTICIWICTILCLLSAAVFLRQQKQVLVVEETETGKIYAEIPIKAGEELCFEWEQSFEHIPWELYPPYDCGCGLRRRDPGRDGLQLPV